MKVTRGTVKLLNRKKADNIMAKNEKDKHADINKYT